MQLLQPISILKNTVSFYRAFAVKAERGAIYFFSEDPKCFANKMNHVCPSQSLYCMRKQHSEPLNSTKFYLGVVGYVRSDQIWKPGV